MLSGKVIKNAIGFLVSLGLVIWLYFSVNWEKVWVHFQSINYWILIPVFIVLVLHFYIRAWRWRFLLPKTEAPPSLNVLFDCLMMGNTANYVLPLRAGEFIRPYLLTNFTKYTFPTAFSSVVVERFFDLAFVLLTFAYVGTQVEGLPDLSKKGALAFGVLAGAILIFIIVGSFLPKLVLTIAEKCTSFLPRGISSKIIKLLEDFLISAKVVSNISNLLIIIALSAAVWFACFFVTYLGLYMFPGEFTLLMALTITVVVALSVAAPSAPGFIGVYQAGCIASFSIFGLSSEMAFTYSIVTHVLNYVLFGLTTIVFCLRNDVKFSQIFKMNKSAAQ